MLYLIIPPIIIIVSLVFLLFLLSRKRTEFYEVESQNSGGNFFGKSIVNKVKSADYSRVNNLMLHLLEKITGKSKVALLRFHNITDRWFRSIRKKRDNGASNKEVGTVMIEKSIVKKEVVEINLEKEDKIIQPMISKEVTEPETKMSIKNELERILIERIAVNPRDIEAYERLGDYYTEQKNFEEARECYGQVLKLSPGHYQAKIRLRRISKILDR